MSYLFVVFAVFAEIVCWERTTGNFNHRMTGNKLNKGQHFRDNRWQEYSFLHFLSKGHIGFLESFPVRFKDEENIFQNKKITAEGL